MKTIKKHILMFSKNSITIINDYKFYNSSIKMITITYSLL